VWAGRTIPVLALAVLLIIAGPALAKESKKAAKQENGKDLTGHVVDTEGKPVKKAEVFLYYNGIEEDGLADRLVGKTKTNICRYGKAPDSVPA